jgi:long-chain acyl-CoA synthetase
MDTRPMDGSMALGEALRRGREQYPDRPALLFEEQRWSYAQVDEITDRMAAALLRLGVQPGDRVALLFGNVPEIVYSYYACFKIGAVAVPLNARLKAPELEYILEHSGVRLLLGHQDLFQSLWSKGTGLPSVQSVYLAGDSPAPPGACSFAELMEQPADGYTFPTVNEDAAAAILYTSGTTARPKGVTHSHRTLQRTIDCYVTHTGLSHEDVVGLFLSVCHIFGFALLLLPAMRTGASVLLLPRFEPEEVLRSLQQHQVTMLGGLPVMYNALVNSPAAAACELNSLKFCLAGGDAAPTELQRRFQATFGVELTEGCGMTEVVPYCLNPAYSAKQPGSIGQAAPGIRLRLVDDEGRDVPPGQVGEVLVQGAACMVGYWNDPEATAATLQDGWLHTGDLGRQDEDGCTWFVGRKKEIIIRGGSNISPLEVEEALYQHPAVREAGVVGAPDPAWGEIVQAYVSLKNGALATEAELKEFLQGRLAAYKVPEGIAFLPELPKGATGKIHRKTLRDRAAAELQN